ncbi:SIMPL domain-containing protein [Thaumasiovibrio sp. DFM-14]|uniref:SIMPL domain-containing protein n=1 Tax=Thaumasiovibrio sp. DFM-14 TaxID=3384792 RepID=UPI0039A053B4
MRIKNLLICLALCLPVAGYAQQPDFAHLEVQGAGRVVIKPDRALFSVEVRKLADSAAEAKMAADQATTQFVERLLALGLDREQIKSANLQLYPEYQYDEQRQRQQVGYRASRRIRVESIILEQLNTLLNAALGDGIDVISQVAMTVADEQPYIQQARQQAIIDAQDKAKEIAAGFGMQLNGVWRIQYSPASAAPIMRAMAMDTLAASGPEDASYQDTGITVSDQISVIFKLLPEKESE